VETEIIKFIINFGGLAVALMLGYAFILILNGKSGKSQENSKDNEELIGKVVRIEKKIDYISNGIDNNSIHARELKQMVKALEQDVKALREVVDKIRDDEDE